jgi:streptogramin lyase
MRARRGRRSGRRPVLAAGLGALALVGLGAGLWVGAGSGGSGPTPAIATSALVSVPAASSVAQGFGSGWLTDDYGHVLRRFDAHSGRLLGAGVPVPGRPASLLAAFGHLWVASMVSDTVTEIDPSSLRTLRTLRVPAGPSGLAQAAGKVWVVSVIAGAITALDPGTGRVEASTTLPDGAVRVAAGYGRLWVTGLSDTLTRVDPHPRSGAVTFRTIAVGQGPLGVVAGAGSVWVASALAGTVVEVDPIRFAVRTRYRRGPDPVAVAIQGGRVWVADGRSDQIATVGTGGAMLTARTLPGVPRQLVAAGDRVWVALGRPGAVVAARAR